MSKRATESIVSQSLWGRRRIQSPVTLPHMHRRTAATSRAVVGRFARAFCIAPIALTFSLTFGWIQTVHSQPAALPDLGDAAMAQLPPFLERRLGEAIMVDGRRDPAYLDDPDLSHYLQQMADRLLAGNPDRGDTRIDAFALREPRINAFAMPGGFIGLHTGLITAAQTESELAGVVAHEIAHVTQRHIARGWVQQQQDSLIALGALAAAVLAARASGSGQLPEAAAVMGQAAAVNSTLRFSRDAEREADRVGFLMLEQAGYDPAGMAGFFGRLMQANRFNQAPSGLSYASTHPVTIERMADMQLRVRDAGGSTHVDSADFFMARVQARVLQAQADPGARRQAAEFLTLQFGEAQNPLLRQAAAYGVARILLDTGPTQLQEVAQWLERAESAAPPHPSLTLLRARWLAASGQTEVALQSLRSAQSQWPERQALQRLQIALLLSLGQSELALELTQTALQRWPQEPALWRLRSQAFEAQGDVSQARRALAEHYALLGALPTAVEVLNQARRASNDFFEQSELDARTRELQRRLLEERELLSRFERR